MKARARATWMAVSSLWWQFWLLADQACNAIVLGVNAVVLAAYTGEEQGVCYADETLSAHTWRSASRRTRWARFLRPAIDALFFWQKNDPVVDAAAGFPVTSHTERAFWKKKLRLGLPPEYRDRP